MTRRSRPRSSPVDSSESLETGLSGPDAAPLLRALGIMNSDGSISVDSRRKLKQVVHLIPLLTVGMRTLPRDRVLELVDLNCGNAYLGLIVRWWMLKNDVRCHLIGVDRDPARIDACRKRARSLDFDNIDFEVGDAADFPLPASPFAVMSLHGCDTATDDALARSVALGAEHVFVSPCCHQEVRKLLQPCNEHLPFLNDGSLAADHAATLTDALRTQWLRAKGYQTQAIEFVPWEHTPRNRLIRASKGIEEPARLRALSTYRSACATLKAAPRVLGAL